MRELTATVLVVAGAMALTSAAETLWPLRLRRVEPRGRRFLRNLSVAGLSLAAVELLRIPILVPVAALARDRRLGLLNLVDLPPAARLVLGVILLDYTLWFWHWANHRVPVLWRFHLVHHVDLDMDASTGLRFHFGEMALSVVFRAAQIAALGAEPAAVALWQTLLFASVLFHHSNTRLPLRMEKVLVGLVVTPRMHAIHHTNRPELTNSNWSSLLTAWDFLHGTFRFDAGEERPVGVPAYADPREVTWGRLVALPFRPRRDDWTSR